MADDASESENEELLMDPLVRDCSLLNAAGANYIIAGAQACILSGMIRTTEDVDLLIEPSERNCARVLEGLAGMEDGWAKELTPRDLIDNVVVKIADEVEVDVSTKAGTVTYAEAIGSALEVTIDGVRIPYLGLDKLIESKSTYREQDRLDVLRLRDLKARREREAAGDE